MAQQNIKDRMGKNLGFILIDPQGNKRAKAINGADLGRYDKKANATYDRNGRKIATGDATMSFYKL